MSKSHGTTPRKRSWLAAMAAAIARSWDTGVDYRRPEFGSCAVMLSA